MSIITKSVKLSQKIGTLMKLAGSRINDYCIRIESLGCATLKALSSTSTRSKYRRNFYFRNIMR